MNNPGAEAPPNGFRLRGILTRLLSRPAASAPPAGPPPASVEETLARQALERERDRLQGLIHTNSDWLWEVDAAGRYTFVSAHCQELLGYTPEQLLGRTPFDLMPQEEAERVGAVFAGIVADKAPFSGLLNRNRRADGRIVVLETSGIPLLGEDGSLLGYRGIDRDVTRREERAAQIDYLARHDALTGLANRPEFLGQLGARLAAGETQPRTAVLLLDLDFFKNVNDRLGHASGDVLLRQLAERLRGLLPPGGLGARLGGDEFAVLLADLDAPAALEMAEAIAASLAASYDLEGRQAVIGVSLGLALAPQHARDAAALMRCADLALYQAKHDGRGRARLYSAALQASASADEGLETALRRAVAEEEIGARYQPFHRARDLRLTGYAALPFWHCSLTGPVAPEVFLAVAERSGIIIPLGALLLRQACAAATRWPEGLRVSVPASAVQLRDPQFPALVREVLAATGLAPERLEIAVTEAALADAQGQAQPTLRKLARQGISIALDHYGCGAMSVAALLSFPFTRLRLGGPHLRQIETEPSASIIQALAGLARRLGIAVGATGIETQGQLDAALREVCDEVQGDILGPSRSAAELAEALLQPGMDESAMGRADPARSAGLDRGIP